MVYKRLSYQERRKELKKRIETIGLWNINKTEFAKEFGISTQMVYKDIDKIIKHTKPTKIGEINLALNSTFKKCIAQCQRILIDPRSTKEEKLKAIDTFNKTAKQYTDFLESFGLKDKIADKLKVDGQVVQYTPEYFQKVYEEVYGK